MYSIAGLVDLTKKFDKKLLQEMTDVLLRSEDPKNHQLTSKIWFLY